MQVHRAVREAVLAHEVEVEPRTPRPAGGPAPHDDGDDHQVDVVDHTADDAVPVPDARHVTRRRTLDTSRTLARTAREEGTYTSAKGPR